MQRGRGSCSGRPGLGVATACVPGVFSNVCSTEIGQDALLMGTAPHCPRGGGAPCSAVENQVSLEPADLSSNPDFAISKHGPRLDIPASVSSSRERVPTPQKEESRKDTLAQGSRGRRAAVLGRVNLYHRTLPAGQRLGLGQWEGRGRREAPRNTLVIPRSRTDATAASRSSPPAWRGRGGRGGAPSLWTSETVTRTRIRVCP